MVRYVFERVCSPTVIMRSGHRIGLQLRALVRQNAGVPLASQRGISLAAFKLENGGDCLIPSCWLISNDYIDSPDL